MQRRTSSVEHGAGVRDSAHNRDVGKNGKDIGDV
jgi:hypothetical protein